VILDERTRDRLAASTRFGDIREFDRIGSTNTWLLSEARAGAADGTVALADHQTAGRGRLGRPWTAPPGSSLLLSVLLRPAGLAPERRHLLAAAVGLAAAGACRRVAGFTPEIKWPNDLMVGDRKLAGILGEADRDAVVVGMGLNVTGAPPGGISAATAAGRAVDRGELLVAILEGLEGWLRDLGAVAGAYRDACATLGRPVRVSLPAGELVGRAEDLDHRGFLLLRTEAGELVEVSVGDVVHLRPA
jgi:BirA family biotin operon repressor/biotin-[acetyl-CoA-carboxylase] ligase